MLDSALRFVVDELNSYLNAKTGLTDKIVVLGPLLDDAGKYAIAKNTVGLSLINIEQETAIKRQLPQASFAKGKTLSFAPELHLNLYVVIAARFELYDQALKYLSHIMNYFQSNTVFTPERTPALGEDIAKLSLELQSLNYDQLNQVWAFIGGKHLPSVYYKIRMLSLQDSHTPSVGQPVLTISNDLQTK
ncbi:MAG: hypothetical protein ACJAVV_002919 [Alphaproteobacteria bacterium]|jgi:hypothetical protein